MEALAQEVAGEACALLLATRESQGLASLCYALGDAAHQAASILHLCAPPPPDSPVRLGRGRGGRMRAALGRAGRALGMAAPREKREEGEEAPAGAGER